MLRKNWINLQLALAKKSFEEAPAWLYYNTPLQKLKEQADKKKRKRDVQKED